MHLPGNLRDFQPLVVELLNLQVAIQALLTVTLLELLRVRDLLITGKRVK